MPIGAALGAAAIGATGSIIASKTNQSSQQQAIALQQQQDAERVREYNQQQAAAAYQWQVQQAQLAPYRAARAAILGKYGINTAQPSVTAPPGFGTPGGIKVPTTLPGGGAPIAVGGADPMALGVTAAAGAGLGAYRLLNQPGQISPSTQATNAVLQGTVINPTQLQNLPSYTGSPAGPSGILPPGALTPDPSLQNVEPS